MGRIVWIASFPKSGNTWVRVFLGNLLAGSDAPADINGIGRFTASEASIEHYRRFDPRPPSDWTRQDVAAMRPRVHAWLAGAKDGLSLVKTHCALGQDHGHPTVNLDVTAGAVYIVRDPLDVAVSFADHLGMSLDHTLRIMAFPDAFTDTNGATVSEMHGSWSRNVASWTARPNDALHVVRFEDLLSRPDETFGALVRFLRIDPAPGVFDRAIGFSSFEALREQEDRSGFRERSTRSQRFFRDGRAGQWKHRLTDAHVAAVLGAHREQMERFGYVPNGR